MEQTQRRQRKLLAAILGHLIQQVCHDGRYGFRRVSAGSHLDDHVGWLDAINAHSFVLIGNAAELPKPARPHKRQGGRWSSMNSRP